MGNKIAVPYEMLSAAWRAVGARMKKCAEDGKGNSLAELYVARIAIEAALEWLATNPTVPNEKQSYEMFGEKQKFPFDAWEYVRWGAVEWQRRMFLASSSVVPEEIEDLLFKSPSGIPGVLHDLSIEVQKSANKQIIEAFNRGKKIGYEEEGKK